MKDDKRLVTVYVYNFEKYGSARTIELDDESVVTASDIVYADIEWDGVECSGGYNDPESEPKLPVYMIAPETESLKNAHKDVSWYGDGTEIARFEYGSFIIMLRVYGGLDLELYDEQGNLIEKIKQTQAQSDGPDSFSEKIGAYFFENDLRYSPGVIERGEQENLERKVKEHVERGHKTLFLFESPEFEWEIYDRDSMGIYGGIDKSFLHGSSSNLFDELCEIFEVCRMLDDHFLAATEKERKKPVSTWDDQTLQGWLFDNATKVNDSFGTKFRLRKEMGTEFMLSCIDIFDSEEDYNAVLKSPDEEMAAYDYDSTIDKTGKRIGGKYVKFYLNVYEHGLRFVGEKCIFKPSSDDEKYTKYADRACTVYQSLPESEYDVSDTGIMWEIEFRDKNRIQAFNHELLSRQAKG